MTEELYNKIDKFCNETDWGKYATYEHALEEFIKGIIAEETKKLGEEKAELKKQLVEKGQHLDLTEKEWGKDVVQMYHFKTLYTKQSEQLTKAKEIIRDFISVAIDYIDKEDKNYSLIVEAEQFLGEVS